MKKAISNILTGFRWPGRKSTTTTNSENPQINAQTSDNAEDSRNSEPQNLSSKLTAGERILKSPDKKKTREIK